MTFDEWRESNYDPAWNEREYARAAWDAAEREMVIEMEAERAALKAATYALFQIKRMNLGAVRVFASAEHEKACAALDRYLPAEDEEYANAVQAAAGGLTQTGIER